MSIFGFNSCKPEQVAKGKRKLFQSIELNKFDNIKRLLDLHDDILEDCSTLGDEGFRHPDLRRAKGLEPIHVAAVVGNTEAIKILVVHDRACITRYCSQGYLAIHYAAKGNNSDVIKLLSDSKADLNAEDKTSLGNTPLHHAVIEDCYNSVRCLIDLHADKNATNNAGKTPIDLAQRNDNRRILDFFQERQDEAKQRVDIGKLSVVTDGIVERMRTLEERMSEDRIARVEQQLSLLTTQTHHATCLTMSHSSISGYGSQELLGSSVRADSADSLDCTCSRGKRASTIYLSSLTVTTMLYITLV